MLKITKNQGSIQVTADKSGFYPFDGTITFPTNSLFTATSANTDMITFKSTSNGDVQFVGNYKDITISGRSYDTKQKFLTAFSNLANQGSVDAYTKAETDAKLNEKQGKLKAGDGITLTEDATDNTTVVKTKLTMDRGPFNDDGIMIGRAAQLETSHGIAFGDESLSKYRGIAIGYKAQSRGTSSIVIGENSSDQDGAAVGTFRGSGVVIGHNARGGGAGVVIGTGAHGGGAGAVIGYNSTVDGNGYGYAIGDNVHISETTNMVPIAIGYGAVADETKPLAITILKVIDTDNDGTPEMKYCDFIQGDANGKLSILKGDGTDERIVIQDALSAGGSGGTVDAYTKAETDAKLDAKQDKLTAGSGITITKDETAGTNTIATAVSLTDNGNGAYEVGNSIGIGGRTSVRIGNNNNVLQGQNSIIIGDHVLTNAEKCIAIGNSSEVDLNSTCSIVIGDSARAYSKNSVAIGYSSNATNDNPLVINAGYKTVDNNDQPLTVLQSDSTGKLSILKGDGTDTRMVIQDEIEALKNAGGGGSVEGLVIDVYKVAVGLDQTSYTNNKSVVIGNQAKAYTDSLVLIGQGVKGWGDDSVVIGRSAESTTNGAAGSVVIGAYAKSSAEYGLSIGKYAEADNTTPLVINAGLNGNIRLTMIQGDANGKISLLKGDGTDTRMVIQDEIAALKAEITTLKAEIAALKGGASTGA